MQTDSKTKPTGSDGIKKFKPVQVSKPHIVNSSIYYHLPSYCFSSWHMGVSVHVSFFRITSWLHFQQPAHQLSTRPPPESQSPERGEQSTITWVQTKVDILSLGITLNQRSSMSQWEHSYWKVMLSSYIK